MTRYPYGLVLRAYPSVYRSHHGGELADTANELHPNGWSARQSWSLLVSGLRTRASVATANDPKQAWAAGIRLALWLVVAISLPGVLASRLGGGESFKFERAGTWPLLMALVPVVVMLFTTRWPAALSVTVAMSGWAFWFYSLYGDSHEWGVLLMQVVVPCLTCWWLALYTDGRRAIGPYLGVALVGSATLSAYWMKDPGAIMATYILFFALPLVGVLLSRVDPRAVIAATASWLYLAASLLAVGGMLTRGEWLGTVAILAVIGFGLLLSRSGANRLRRSVTR